MKTAHPPSPGRARGTLEFHSTIPGARIRKHYLLACARHATRHIVSSIGELNFVLVNDRKMARLHREFAGVRGTTDVLTFDMSVGPDPRLDGDVYICLDQARRQAHEYRVPLYQEVARLAIHGVLHLAGCPDKTARQRSAMRDLENRSLRAGSRVL